MLTDSLFPTMTTDSTPAAKPAQDPRALLKKLHETYPAFRDHAPLAIGIDKQLLARQSDIERKALRIALGMHTNSLRYLKTMEKATQRVDLDGQVVAEVTEEHRQHAAETLRERFRKDAERRKAQRLAEEQERQRTQKLNQLVEKFGKPRSS
ncbi:ProQ/FINO family protein [Propionivibrio dicarboxylicus]